MKNFKHLIFSLAILMAANYAVAQTTVNLADQCNCEVFYSSTVVNGGATAPAGADEGDLLVDNLGNTFFWDGDSWEPTADNTIEPWFGTDDDAVATDNTEDIYQKANVGIGETDPLVRLDVRGLGLDLPATSGTTPTNGTRARIGNRVYILDIGINDQGDNGEIWFQSTNRNDLSVGSTILLNPNGGKVAVGKSNPKESLDVEGNIKASGNLQSGTATYPDYVFEAYEEGSSVLNKSYAFKSLSEVESFIKINKHLPGVKSITELEKTADGLYNVDITAASMQTLEKVEELFLHTIEQEKKINTLSTELAELKAQIAEIKAAIQK